MAATHTNARVNLTTSDRRLAEQLADNGDLRASVSLILASGGDMRIWPDPISGRNRYGTKTSPAPDEISFSSTTASNISVEGFAAASQALQRLFGTGGETAVAPDQWFDEVRNGIVELLGAPGSKAVLTASGTDAELLTLGLATALSTRPITNVFIAPDETGNGIPLAAAGRHFSGMTALAYRDSCRANRMRSSRTSFRAIRLSAASTAAPVWDWRSRQAPSRTDERKDYCGEQPARGQHFQFHHRARASACHCATAGLCRYGTPGGEKGAGGRQLIPPTARSWPNCWRLPAPRSSWPPMAPAH